MTESGLTSTEDHQSAWYQGNFICLQTCASRDGQEKFNACVIDDFHVLHQAKLVIIRRRLALFLPWMEHQSIWGPEWKSAQATYVHIFNVAQHMYGPVYELDTQAWKAGDRISDVCRSSPSMSRRRDFIESYLGRDNVTAIRDCLPRVNEASAKTMDRTLREIQLRKGHGSQTRAVTPPCMQVALVDR